MPVPRAPQRSRGTAAVVLSRPDPPAAPARAQPPQPDAGAGWPRWFAIFSSLTLGAALLGIWALLLLGDSLHR
jgi:hypothetical protein